MVLSIITAAFTCLLLILAVLFKPTIKIKNIELQTFWIISLIGALIMIIFNITPISLLIEKLKENQAVNPIKILTLFISMSFLSIVLDSLGFFKFLATKVLSIFKNSQIKLFISLYILIALLTVFTSNDIVILTFTPFICYFSKRANINPIPFLVMEFITANTYSMMFTIGNPTNIYLSQSFSISFFDYLKIMFFPTILGGISSLIILLILFRKSLKKEIQAIDVVVENVKNKPLTIISFIILISCTILLAISSYINLEMWLICFSSFLILSIILLLYSIKSKDFKIIKESYKRLPYSLIIFVLSMFTIVLGLVNKNVTAHISDLLIAMSKNEFLESLTFGVVSTISDNLINNIPMSILFSTIIPNSKAAIFSTIIGSNIGAYLTPIGALAGIMWMSILKKNDVDYSFKKFTFYGIILVPIVLLVSLCTLVIIL